MLSLTTFLQCRTQTQAASNVVGSLDIPLARLFQIADTKSQINIGISAKED